MTTALLTAPSETATQSPTVRVVIRTNYWDSDRVPPGWNEEAFLQDAIAVWRMNGRAGRKPELVSMSAAEWHQYETQRCEVEAAQLPKRQHISCPEVRRMRSDEQASAINRVPTTYGIWADGHEVDKQAKLGWTPC